VEIRITELFEQLNKTKDVELRKHINCLITTYEYQKLSLEQDKKKR